MKTNILKQLSFVAILTIAMGGCKESDFLDHVNPNQAVEKTFWTSEANAQSAMATVYSPIRGQMYGYYGGYTGWHTMNRADDVWFILGEEMLNCCAGWTCSIGWMRRRTAPLMTRLV